MLGLRQRIAFTAVLLIGVVPSESKAFTIEECYDAVQHDYANCKAGEYFDSHGLCENRARAALASCQRGIYVRPGESSKDQCLQRVEAEYRNCGYRAACSNRWIQGLNECASIPSNY
jgi:hypothetical protein